MIKFCFLSVCRKISESSANEYLQCGSGVCMTATEETESKQRPLERPWNAYRRYAPYRSYVKACEPLKKRKASRGERTRVIKDLVLLLL